MNCVYDQQVGDQLKEMLDDCCFVRSRTSDLSYYIVSKNITLYSKHLSYTSSCKLDLANLDFQENIVCANYSDVIIYYVPYSRILILLLGIERNFGIYR